MNDEEEKKEELNFEENLEPKEDSSLKNVEDPQKNNKAPVVICLLLIILIGGLVGSFYLNKNNKENKTEVESTKKYSAYRITGNKKKKFDLYFLQLENEEKNKVYSPLSIKYALEMLAEGANGESKSQIDAVIGDYVAKKYVNSKNMSFANAMFIKNSVKNSVKSSYKEKLLNKYNADVIYDDFKNATNLNNWVKNKTLNLISDLFDDELVNNSNFVLANALAIDMEWVKTIQPDETRQDYNVNYAHEDFSQFVGFIMDEDSYGSTKFNNNSMNAKTVEIAAAINKYDIVKTLGEENIRKTVSAEYEKWLKGEGATCEEATRNTKEFVDGYIKELDSNYKKVNSSTDFLLYDDDEVKTFAKDLKTYDNVTLQYVGIMPKNTNLKTYIKEIDEQKINSIINNLKEVELDNFKEGVITEIVGKIPLFKFDYTLDLINDLKKLNITDVFDDKKANLSNITDEESFIKDSSHKAKIEFSNKGIKAAATTAFYGGDTMGCFFEYNYKVPVETIDLTFNNPYMFLIRDKNSGEVWFAGTVYNPIEGTEPTGE